MKQKTIFIISMFFQTLLPQETFSYDNQYVHQLINGNAAHQSINLQAALKTLGYKNIDDTVNKKAIWQWFHEGAKLEDETPCRSRNHFHDPTKKPWDKAGLNNILLNDACKTFAGERYLVDSSIIWSQNKVDNLYSWPKARDYYYDALTGKIKGKREESLAMTFRSVGQVMHLLADASVPEHVRNDIHVFPINQDTEIVGPYIQRYLGDIALGTRTYETWTKENVRNLTYTGAQPDVSILNEAVSDKNASIPISSLWDINKYLDRNPSTWVPGSADIVGLAEYTNANFLSKDTTPSILLSDAYPHPSLTETNYYNIQLSDLENIDAEDGKIDRRFYISKYTGVPIKRLAAISYIHFDLLNLNIPVPTGPRLFILDDNCFKEYASHLVPKAVGYDITSLNYFFRGDIRLEYVTSPAPGHVITNRTEEDIDGLFQIFYDNTDGEREEYMYGTFGLKANTQGDVFYMAPPSNAMEPGKYILVFRGQMGNEKDAVAGYVYSEKMLEITAPSEFVYGIIDGGVETQQFTALKAGVRNASGQQIGPGTLRAVASYRKRTDYQPDLSAEPPTFEGRAAKASASFSAPQGIASLSSTDAVQYTFDFTADPIPVGVTDLYLDIIFEGQVGDTAQGMIAGWKDLDEPHHLLLYNLTDRYEVDHVLYTAEEILADRQKFYYLINQTWGHMNFYPHPMTMTLFFSGNKTVFPAHAAVIEELPAARYARIIFLVDEPDTFYLLTMLTADNTTTFYNDSMTGLVNQFDGSTWTFNPAIQYRGSWSHDWWGFWNCYPYPVGNVCTGGEWPILQDLTPYPVRIIGP